MGKLNLLPMRLFALIIFCFALSYSTGAAHGAADAPQRSVDLCPPLVAQALDATNTICQSAARNQMCYGHNLLSVEAQDFVSQLTFNAPGDLVPVTEIRSVRGSALDLDHATWGIALMRLQADLPDSLPTQNVTFLLFGDSQIIAAHNDITTLPVITSAASNLRSGPSARDAVLSSVGAGTQLTATGRLADSSWLRIGIPGQDNQFGWLFASLATSEAGDFNTLEIVDPSVRTPTVGPLSAFYLTTNETTPACEQLPASGLVIQTPEGAGTVRLYINEVQVDIGSTVFFQASANGAMTISTLEGMARVEAQGRTEVVAAGSQLRVPLDANLAPAGPPGMPEPYAEGAFQSLPTSKLDRPIEVAPPLTEDTIDIVHDKVQSDQPVCGVDPLPHCSTITIEGVVQSISPDSITVNGMVIALAADSPLRRLIAVGTTVHIEGNLDSTGTLIIIIKLIVRSAPAPNPPGGPPSAPGMGDPGMGDNGMGDNGMGDNGMGDNGMGDNGMSDNGMGDNGMGDNGMGDNGMGMGMGNG